MFLAAVSATIVMSCGGGGGSSDGALCQQCGDTDGPCQFTAFIVPGADQPAPCPTPPSTASPCVERKLICRRQADSSQQHCYPADAAGTQVDFFFKCDGEPPGSTPVPPVPTITSTAPSPTPGCGNGIIDEGEQCDGSNFAGRSCTSLLCGGGTLQCNSDCTLNAAFCTIQPCFFR